MDEANKESCPAKETAPRLKVICRMQGDTYTEKLVAEENAGGGEDAQVLLHAFAPETLTRSLTAACGEGSVVVFRTDSRQMEEYRALLDAHDGAER